ncbi:hypothetical protein KU306_03775 [Haloferax larsenii]|uniref:Halobacterial output domain-containing protein n=1 Tax=Haloferax larsenii TaxID=302484 RepID=A0ABY5RF89_HALLR|nr:hypothetical protein [Haloferax larsenii]ELZ80312.1 hypothetical protein C455_05561 [Haloferax larsenii JCM 13917]UVE51016.1 hypothetical protein KU306_03775 [Haloferax larsenii]
MSNHEAAFEIESPADATATRRILAHAYDTIREESRTVREGTEDATELLDSFQELRDAVQSQSPGRLTITYHSFDEEFDSSESRD